MNWLEQEEYNKKQREISQNNFEEQRLQNEKILHEKLKGLLSVGLILQKRVNEAFSQKNKSDCIILGGLHYSSASFESGGFKKTKEYSNDYDNVRYNYIKRKFDISTTHFDVCNFELKLIEDHYEYSSYRDSDWSYSSWSTYENKVKEELLVKNTYPLERLKLYNEEFWLNVFEWLMFKTNKLKY